MKTSMSRGNIAVPTLRMPVKPIATMTVSTKVNKPGVWSVGMSCFRESMIADVMDEPKRLRMLLSCSDKSSHM